MRQSTRWLGRWLNKRLRLRLLIGQLCKFRVECKIELQLRWVFTLTEEISTHFVIYYAVTCTKWGHSLGLFTPQEMSTVINIWLRLKCGKMTFVNWLSLAIELPSSHDILNTHSILGRHWTLMPIASNLATWALVQHVGITTCFLLLWDSWPTFSE